MEHFRLSDDNRKVLRRDIFLIQHFDHRSFLKDRKNNRPEKSLMKLLMFLIHIPQNHQHQYSLGRYKKRRGRKEKLAQKFWIKFLQENSDYFDLIVSVPTLEPKLLAGVQKNKLCDGKNVQKLIN